MAALATNRQKLYDCASSTVVGCDDNPSGRSCRASRQRAVESVPTAAQTRVSRLKDVPANVSACRHGPV